MMKHNYLVNFTRPYIHDKYFQFASTAYIHAAYEHDSQCMHGTWFHTKIVAMIAMESSIFMKQNLHSSAG